MERENKFETNPDVSLEDVFKKMSLEELERNKGMIISIQKSFEKSI